MKDLLRKYGPSALHAFGTVVIFLDASVQQWMLTHKADSGIIFLVWGWLLHAAPSWIAKKA